MSEIKVTGEIVGRYFFYDNPDLVIEMIKVPIPALMKQEPLGEEFQKVLNQNMDDLYES